MNIGDTTEFKDRKGNSILIGDKLKLNDGRIGNVFYAGTVQVAVPSDGFMKASTVMTIGLALGGFKGVKLKEV